MGGPKRKSLSGLSCVLIGIITAVVICGIFATVIISQTTDWFDPSKVTAEEFHRLEIGMTYEDVCRALGDKYIRYHFEDNLGTPRPAEKIYTYEGVGDDDCEVTLGFIDEKLAWYKHTGLYGEAMTSGWKFE